MDIDAQVGFSALAGSSRIETRLAQGFMHGFDRLATGWDAEWAPLLSRADDTGTWQSSRDSVRRALSWDLLPGRRLTLVLLDDEEFGPEMRWVFSPGAAHLDYKYLIVFVERSMDLMLDGDVTPDAWRDRLAGPRAAVDVAMTPPAVIRSRLFCWSFPSGDLPGDLPAGRWPVLEGVEARATGARQVLVEPGCVLQGPAREAVLSVLRVQAEAVRGT